MPVGTFNKEHCELHEGSLRALLYQHWCVVRQASVSRQNRNQPAYNCTQCHYNNSHQQHHRSRSDDPQLSSYTIFQLL